MAPLLPILARRAHTFLSETLSSGLSGRSPSFPDGGSALGPLAAHALLAARDDADTYTGPDPSKGVVDPHNINNNAMFALFALIGVAFVVTGIWFFFWAKNGGFHFKKDDWDEYKSTVLRRKGPNGTTLSGATPSTQLGGGSVYKDVVTDDGSTEDATTVVSGTTGLTGVTAGASDIAGRERRRKKREQKEREKERRREEKAREKEKKKSGGGRKKAGRRVGEDGVLVDEDAEAEAKAQLRNYRHEKPARVGGLNREAEGSSWDGSTNPSQSTAAGTESTVTSELISNRERTPTSTPTKQKDNQRSAGAAGGIRKVYSTADKTASREARRMREEGRSAGHSSRRDFSFQRAGGESSPRRLLDEDEREVHVPGTWVPESEVGGEDDGDLGTKAYHHVIPGLSSVASSSNVGSTVSSDYAEEKRKKRGGAGYRRNH
ncbi:Endosomal spry domain-containing protein [Pleurostoma richardsiae]|uniref:Endosomal spry domain-containing protein n=1 Tax=Pleurostoma richardsiae TaxID=41990 RepID=A0AA38VDP2_9PEZI|nr:Endosomal spry domain-containing protein [Pleurostoma richardsiae]